VSSPSFVLPNKLIEEDRTILIVESIRSRGPLGESTILRVSNIRTSIIGNIGIHTDSGSAKYHSFPSLS
jgi:hypothetical protein